MLRKVRPVVGSPMRPSERSIVPESDGAPCVPPSTTSAASVPPSSVTRYGGMSGSAQAMGKASARMTRAASAVASCAPPTLVPAVLSACAMAGASGPGPSWNWSGRKPEAASVSPSTCVSSASSSSCSSW